MCSQAVGPQCIENEPRINNCQRLLIVSCSHYSSSVICYGSYPPQEQWPLLTIIDSSKLFSSNAIFQEFRRVPRRQSLTSLRGFRRDSGVCDAKLVQVWGVVIQGLVFFCVVAINMNFEALRLRPSNLAWLKGSDTIRGFILLLLKNIY